MKYKIIVIGASAGGIDALIEVLSPLPADFPIPVLVVQHLPTNNPENDLVKFLDGKCQLKVKEADDKELITPGNVYFAPANYHMLIENDNTVSLSIDEKVRYCRPSIDVLFESARDAFSSEIIGIILTGANTDGADGIRRIKNNGGITIVQNPETAELSVMPLAAIQSCDVDYILLLKEIPELLVKLSTE